MLNCETNLKWLQKYILGFFNEYGLTYSSRYDLLTNKIKLLLNRNYLSIVAIYWPSIQLQQVR